MSSIRDVWNRERDIHRVQKSEFKWLALARFALVGHVFGAAGCGSDTDGSTPEPVQQVAPISFIDMDGRAPESAYWDDTTKQLYIVDNAENRVWKWTDRNGIGDFASLPIPTGETELAPNVSLGQAALLPDGTFVVNRFGQPGGGAGDIAYIAVDGSSGTVPNLDPTRRRLGLALGSDGVLYGSYFAGSAGNLTGFLTTVDLTAGETVIAEGFGKIVGLAFNDGRLYVSDQSAGQILDAPLTALPPKAADWHVMAALVKPDQICVGPKGSLFSGQFQGAPGSTEPIAVRHILADGRIEIFKADPDVSKPSGLAYDPTNHRLFVADSGNLAQVGVHVFEVPQ